MVTIEQTLDLNTIAQKRKAIKHAGIHALAIADEIRRLLRIGLEAMRRYQPYVRFHHDLADVRY